MVTKQNFSVYQEYIKYKMTNIEDERMEMKGWESKQMVGRNRNNETFK